MRRTAPRVILATILATLSACTEKVPEVWLLRPASRKLLDRLALEARIEITNAANEVVASTSLAITDEAAVGSLPELPAGEDLAARVFWSASGVTIAASEQRSVRIEPGKTQSLSFDAGSYTYPDEDGDGAINLYELVWAADNPGLGDGVTDPEVLPAGFFNSIVGAAAVGGDFSAPVAVEPINNIVVVGSVDIDVDTPTPYRNHRANIFVFPMRQRTERRFDCAGTMTVLAIAINPKASTIAAAACGNAIHFFDPVNDIFAGGPYATAQNRRATSLVFTGNGEALYAIDGFEGTVAVFGDGGAAANAQVEALLDDSFFGAGSEVWSVAELGAYLLFIDPILGALHVVSHEDHRNHTLVATALPGELIGARAIVTHPSGDEIFVAKGSQGTVAFIDTSNTEIDAWQIVAELEVAVGVDELALEPTYGIWLYAVSPDSIARIDTARQAVEWRYDLADDYSGGFEGLALGSDGKIGVAVGGGSALVQLGVSVQDHLEREPNHRPSNPGGAIGPPPALSVGWGDINENTEDALEFIGTAYDFSGPIPYREDIEDLWRLDTTGASGGLALAILPTAPMSRFGIALLDGEGDILAVDMDILQAVPLTTGTGVFLITPPVSELPPETLVGVIAKDLDRTANFSAYEVVAVEVDYPLFEISENEPNEDPETADPVMLYGSILRGVAESSDNGAFYGWGSEDVEDCFIFDVGSGRVGVRLDFAADVDLDLTVHDMTGVRVPGSYGLLGPGLPEYFVFEPWHPANHFLVCVTSEDATQPASVPYSLTMIDFHF